MNHHDPELESGADDDEPLTQSASRMKPSLTAGHHSSTRSVWRLRAQRRAEAAAQAAAEAQAEAAAQAEGEAEAEEQKPVLAEWHTLTASERDIEWAQLCAWVTWLHDRYELDVEERLPRCWAQHPGMIEELRALRAWRVEIYGVAGSTGQAARYWHAELRQTMTAAATFYASGCRAGHRGSTHPAHSDPSLQQRWTYAEHCAGIPPELLTAQESADQESADQESAGQEGSGQEAVGEGKTVTRPDSYYHLTETTMTDHLGSGAATPMSQKVAEFVHHDGFWWAHEDGGWLRVIDVEMHHRHDENAKRLQMADLSCDKVRAQRAGDEPDQGGNQ